MNTEKVMEVLRRVEWVRRGSPPVGAGQCPWCEGWESDGGHRDGCKLAAMLGEGLMELLPKAHQEPVVKIWVLGPIEGLRARLVARLFNLAAWLAGYDVELEIGEETGSE